MTTETLTEEEFEPQTSLPLQGPGEVLRIAREKAKLNQEDVAKHLRLTSTVIQAIENNDFQLGPKFVFIRGYLRAYANLLDLSGDEIIESFDSLNLVELPSDRPSRDFSLEHTTLKDKYYRWVTYGVILSILVLFAIWWHNHRMHSTNGYQTTIISNVITKSVEKDNNPVKQDAVEISIPDQS